MMPIRLRTVLLPALLTAFVLFGLRVLIAHAAAAGPDSIDAVDVPADQAPAVVKAPAALPPEASAVVQLWRAGYLAAAVALALHGLLGLALARWSWVVAAAPVLGRGRWRSIAASLLAALTVTLPAAATGELTWPGLIVPLLVGVALALLPGMPQPAQPAQVAA